MKTHALRILAAAAAAALLLSALAGCKPAKEPVSEEKSEPVSREEQQDGSAEPASREELPEETTDASAPAASQGEKEPAGSEPFSEPPSFVPEQPKEVKDAYGLIYPSDITEPFRPTCSISEEDRKRQLALFTKTRDAELEWLADLQAPNGAIPQAPPDVYSKSRVITCFSAQVCMAYLLKPEQYGDRVRRYLDWYLSHLNTAKEDPCGVDGTMFDYDLTYSADRKTVTEEPVYEPNSKIGHYDSTDAYAAFTLKILWEYAEACDDHAYLLAHKTEIERLTHAIFASMDDGLTWARPDYEIKYTMDNLEVWRGLSSLVKMEQKVFIPAASGEEKAKAEAAMKKHLQAANMVMSRIETELWDEKNGHYQAGLNVYGTPYMTFDWDNHYPCAMAQIESIAMGIVQPGSPRAKRLYDAFNVHWSTGKKEKNWETLDIGSLFICANNALCGATMGDLNRTEIFVRTYHARIQNGRLWPVYNADVAMVAQACQRAIEYLNANNPA